MQNHSKSGNSAALLPIVVFVILYLGLGIVYEYILKIPMGFYSIPVVVIFLVALLIACIQNRNITFDRMLEIMGNGVGDKNIITMILIFLTAGIFIGTVGRSSVDSVAYFMLSLIPTQYAIVVLFIVACFVSLSMGTSVGTITLITPIAVSLADASGLNMALCVGSVISGSMFGDNLSFISDTTIAACNGQGCKMSDKFRENFPIAISAAIITLAIIFVMSFTMNISETSIDHEYNLIMIIPYLLVLLGGVIGINVFIILIIGIVSGSLIIIATGGINPTDLLINMGSGAAGMFETSMIAILVACICSLIRENGGFESLLSGISAVCKGFKGKLLGIGILVGIMNIATANNTVAIVMANPIAKEMAESSGISPKQTASILDIFSCIFQGSLPYGAQMLVAVSIVAELGFNISAFNIIPNLVYPFVLLICALIYIFFFAEKRAKKQNAEKCAEHEIS